MQTIGKEITSWNDSHRPLRTLTKAQLFKYPDADPSDTAYWDFSKEIIARRAAYDQLNLELERTERDISGAQHRLNSAKANLATAKSRMAEAESKGELLSDIQKNIVAACTRAVSVTEDGLAKAVEANARMKRRLEQPSKEDMAVSEEELQAFYANRHAPEWDAIVQAWNGLNLFTAQRHGWGTFLSVRKPEQAADAKAFWNASGVAILVGQEKSHLFLSMHALYHTRIAPSLGGRREFLIDNHADGGLNVAGLKPEAQRRYKRWHYAYNMATLSHGWKDDAGDITDTRYFNPKEMTEENDD